ncbi:putative pyrimidine 5-nucleotidase [Sinorhizobium fredii NGR234]|uniref:Pyrimidine 5-nucleotidase n=2 Tax=Rhizobium fredii TaxID=380 RepID=C3MF37_SINFN|nr:putative pyrimidine 5-nucleotidase [Sinorhizobium fredii NGR234]
MSPRNKSVFLAGAPCHKAAMKKLDRLPTREEFAHVTDWVFDLDNTLYPHHVNLFAQIDKNMTAYVAELLSLEPAEAKKLQKEYYRDHGTTLQGLMIHHGIDPNDFLERAHAIDYSVVPANPDLGDAIKALPGRKFIFTNGSVAHAEMTARALGILDHFDNIFDIVAAGYLPKPAGDTYDKFMSLHRVDTQHAAMFEDLPRNLLVPKALGMKTILLVPRNLEYEFAEAWETSSDADEQIDYVTEDLAGFLRRVVAEA